MMKENKNVQTKKKKRSKQTLSLFSHPADRRDLDRERVLVVVRARVRVVRHQLLVRAVPRGDGRLNKVDELGALRPAGEEEVEPAVGRPNPRGARVGARPQNRLLQEEKSALVAHVLPDLGAGDPARGVGGRARAVDALVRLDGKVDDAGLLQGGSPENLGLDGQLDLDPARVGLGPDEPGVDEADAAVAAAGRGRAFADPFHAAEAEGEELLGLWGRSGPVLRGLEVALAGGAPEDREL